MPLALPVLLTPTIVPRSPQRRVLLLPLPIGALQVRPHTLRSAVMPPLDLVRTVAVAVTPAISVLPVTSAVVGVADEATSKKYAGLAALQHTLRF